MLPYITRFVIKLSEKPIMQNHKGLNIVNIFRRKKIVLKNRR